MGAEPHQLQGIRIGPAIDQHQVRLDVAIAMIPPIAGQSVIAVSLREWLVGREQSDDCVQLLAEGGR